MSHRKNPFRRISTSLIYDNPWITVIEDRILKPNGTEGIYGKVHFKQRAIGIIPVDGQGNTWLIGQYRYTLSEYSWEIPMGGGHPDEAPVDAAKRELKEETGLSAQKWRQIMKLHLSNSVTDEVGYVFLAEDLTAGDPDFDDTEVLEIRKMPLKDAVQWVHEGRISDAESVAGLLKAARILGI